MGGEQWRPCSLDSSLGTRCTLAQFSYWPMTPWEQWGMRSGRGRGQAWSYFEQTNYSPLALRLPLSAPKDPGIESENTDAFFFLQRGGAFDGGGRLEAITLVTG